MVRDGLRDKIIAASLMFVICLLLQPGSVSGAIFR